VASLPMPEIFSGEENRKDSVDERFFYLLHSLVEMRKKILRFCSVQIFVLSLTSESDLRDTKS